MNEWNDIFDIGYDLATGEMVFIRKTTPKIIEGEFTRMTEAAANAKTSEEREMIIKPFVQLMHAL